MPISHTWSDQELMKFILAEGALKEKAANYLMDTNIHYLPKVAQKTGLNRDQALDAFTDAIIVVMENVAKGSFKGESKLSSYFYKIFFNKSVDLFRKNTTNKVDYKEVLPDPSDQEPLIANKMETQEAIKELYKYLDKIGTPCKQILIDWGFWGYSMTEIAERTGLVSSVQAKDRKYQCLKKLRKMMNE